MTDTTGQQSGAEDEVHRKFREALERKQARAGDPHQSQGPAGKGVGPSSNDKHQRQFRRKSGG